MKSLFNLVKPFLPYIIGLILIIITSGSLKLYLNEIKTTTRLTDNLAAVQKENIYYIARNKDQAVKIQSQELTIKEIRSTIPGVIAELKNLYIQLRQLQSYTQASVETGKHIITTLRDSVILDTIKIIVIDYSDKWFTVKGTIRDKVGDLLIISRDSLIVANYLSRRPHPWLWIFGGRRHPECTITNKNPNNTYSIQKSITVKN